MQARVRIRQELRALVPFARRFLGVQAVTNRELELRVPPDDADEAVVATFQREFQELLALDHPGFLPVLGWGVTNRRLYYTVPLRSHPRLLALVRDGALAPGERIGAARALAGALAHLHLRGLWLREPDLETLAWDRAQGQVYFLHHLDPARPATEDDARRELEAGQAADVLWWGHLAYRILTDGEPLEEVGSRAPPPLELADSALAAVVEAALGTVRGQRPQNGIEIHATLQAPVAAAPPPEGEDEDAEAEVALVTMAGARTAAERVSDTIRQLHATGKIQPPEVFSPVPAVASVVAESRWEELGRVLLALALGLVFGGIGGWFAGSQAARRALPRAAPAVDAGPERTLVLAPSTQVELTKRPDVRAFLDAPPVTAKSFPDLWDRLRKLVLGERLPPQFLDHQPVMDLRALHRRDPAAAAAALEELRGKIRTALEG